MSDLRERKIASYLPVVVYKVENALELVGVLVHWLNLALQRGK